MTRAQALRLIEKAFSALHAANIQRPGEFGSIDDKLLSLCVDGERKYRKWAGPRPGLSVRNAAKLFAVRFLAEALEKPGRYTLRHILEIRHEALYAQAYAELFGAEIRAAWDAAGVTVADLLALDYAELVKG
jgi:hypothetical protein